MRREHFDLKIRNVDWIDSNGDLRMPQLGIHYEGDISTLRSGLATAPYSEDAAIEPREIDITVRLHGSPDDHGADGVVAVTDRVTGEYLLELNVDANQVLSFITAARRYGEQTDGAAQYTVHIHTQDGEAMVFEKETLLVYADDGELLRQYSLIPSGVEI